MFSISILRGLSAIPSQLLNVTFLGGSILVIKETAIDVYVGGTFTSAIRPQELNAGYGAVINSVNANWLRNLKFNISSEVSNG